MSPRRKKLGREYDSSAALLQGAGLRPTRQRLALADWLFAGCDKHVTAEDVHAAAAQMKVRISLATVYNTLNIFTKAGLLHSLALVGGQVYFDTNTNGHFHVFDQENKSLEDIPVSSVKFSRLPRVPKGKALSRVDVVFRVSRTSGH